MTRPRPQLLASPHLSGLVHGLLATGLAGFGLALLLMPQRIVQRPLRQAIVTLHVGAEQQLRLWHQPIQRRELNTFLRATASRHPGSRLRVIPDPQVNWGQLRLLLQELQVGPLPVELQLPPGGSHHG
jgi:hypothetical protein